MDNRFDKLFEMVLEIRDQTVKNSTVLEEHARRSAASEERLEVQEHKLEKFMEHVEQRLEPINDHIKQVSWFSKLIIGAGVATGTILGIIEAIQKLF